MSIKLLVENAQFSQRVSQLSGEDIAACFQCGVCSSACPVSHEMDLKPSTLIRYVQLGIRNVLKSKTIWTCSSCFSCLARCPRNIDIATVAEALRQLDMRVNGDYITPNQITDEERKRLPQIAIISALRKKAV